MRALLDNLDRVREAAGVPRVLRRCPGAREFVQVYYAANRAVLLKQVIDPSVACTTWSPRALAARFGEAIVHARRLRGSNGALHIPTGLDYVRLTLREVVERPPRAAEGLYVAGDCEALAEPALQVLLREVPRRLPILDRRRLDANYCKLWVSGGPTVTPMHRDETNVLLVQLHGRKRITLVPSPQLPRLLDSTGIWSSVRSATERSLDRELRSRGVTTWKFTLAPRDALFIPIGWWHDVRSDGPSVSLSFLAFADVQ
jgi:hypothetical protein